MFALHSSPHKYQKGATECAIWDVWYMWTISIKTLSEQLEHTFTIYFLSSWILIIRIWISEWDVYCIPLSSSTLARCEIWNIRSVKRAYVTLNDVCVINVVSQWVSCYLILSAIDHLAILQDQLTRPYRTKHTGSLMVWYPVMYIILFSSQWICLIVPVMTAG